ncbi:MAG: 1-acyl-sn-glycerol-3-phosphate acyltransferase [Chloroflexota bacterium]|jgi:1-acyl-sn-glycerol-3-phosphate acyltransferase|nr:1-acyl-sn-glycerol-3-phosphate acyltransferase [Chloroflexota bacterium]
MTDGPTKGVPLLLRIAGVLSRTMLRLGARVTIQVDGEIPKEGPLIVVANHISNSDPPLVAGWLTPMLGRQMHILAKQSLFVGPLGWILRKLGATPVKSGGSDIEAYRVARAVLDRGDVLCIFPEGTRSATGLMQEPKPGVAMLATRTSVPILPVGVSGSDYFLGRGKKLPRLRAPIRLHVGKTFTLRLDPNMPHRQALAAASDDLMRHIAALVDERHRGRFG